MNETAAGTASKRSSGSRRRVMYRIFRFGPILAVRRWFKHLSSADQRAITVVAMFLLAVGLYLLAWQPLRTGAREAQAYYESRQELHAWVQRHAKEVRELQGKRESEGGSGQLAGQSLLSVVTTTAKSRKLDLKRFEPRGDNAVNLWLEGVSFNTLVQWLDELRDQHAINVTQIAVDRLPGNPGQVTVKLSLAS